MIHTVNTHERLQKLMDERGWSKYRLSKECGLSESTLEPSIATLEAICSGFGITLSQFFADDTMVELSPELKELFDNWVALTPEQKQLTIQIMKAFQYK